jgi:hypothetical protein
MLFACPFCREMFDKREGKICEVCGVALVAFDRLPPSTEALSEGGVPESPELQTLPATYMGRGRGAVAVLGALGLLAFLLPWVKETLPDIVDYSGLELGKRLGWVWGAGVAWVVLVPTVISRRSIVTMRGARLVASLLGAVPGATALLLLLRPPHGGRMVPLRFTYGPGLFATLALSAAAVAAGILLGGRVDDIRVARGTSRGQVVH